MDNLWEFVTTSLDILEFAWLLATIAFVRAEALARKAPESLAQIPTIDVLFLHGYIEQPVIGPSLPDANTMFVADAAIELIRAGKVKQVVIATNCDFGDPEHNFSVAKKTYHYMRARLGEDYDIPITAVPATAETTIQEIEDLNQLAVATIQDGILVKTFAELCLDPHYERITTLRQTLMGKRLARQIPLYKAGDIFALSEDDVTKEYAADFLDSLGVAAFARREKTYRLSLLCPSVGIAAMKLADRIQGPSKSLAEKSYQAALRRVSGK